MLDPLYVDVILRRFEAVTGIKPILVESAVTNLPDSASQHDVGVRPEDADAQL